MGVLQDRLVITNGLASLRSSATAVTEVVGHLAGIDSPIKLVGQGGLTAADLIAALAQAALGDDNSMGPPLIQAKPQLPALLRSLSEPAWVAVFPGAPHRARLCLAAGLLQVHDFWDASHDAAQKADDQGERACSAYWHGIAHRREPDAGNAAYWFRRVGKHPSFQALALLARPLLDGYGDSQLSSRLISGDAWNATAMIDFCIQARPGTPEETLARRLQRLEMWLLLESTYAAIAG
jgi:hypothetical protein